MSPSSTCTATGASSTPGSRRQVSPTRYVNKCFLEGVYYNSYMTDREERQQIETVYSRVADHLAQSALAFSFSSSSRANWFLSICFKLERKSTLDTSFFFSLSNFPSVFETFFSVGFTLKLAGMGRGEGAVTIFHEGHSQRWSAR